MNTNQQSSKSSETKIESAKLNKEYNKLADALLTENSKPSRYRESDNLQGKLLYALAVRGQHWLPLAGYPLALLVMGLGEAVR